MMTTMMMTVFSRWMRMMTIMMSLLHHQKRRAELVGFSSSGRDKNPSPLALQDGTHPPFPPLQPNLPTYLNYLNSLPALFTAFLKHQL